jgi:hypothetical protein
MRWSPPSSKIGVECARMEGRSAIAMKKEETESEMTTIGLDLAKQVVHVVGCDSKGKEVKRKRLTRGTLAAYVANLPPCLVAM